MSKRMTSNKHLRLKIGMCFIMELCILYWQDLLIFCGENLAGSWFDTKNWGSVINILDTDFCCQYKLNLGSRGQIN